MSYGYSMSNTAASGAGQAAMTGIGMYAGYKIGEKSDKVAFERQKWLMRNAHQMEVEDLKNAGLNPILSAGGSGAHSASVSSTSSQSAMSGAQTAMQLSQAMKESNSRVNANNAASARDIAAAKETEARRFVEYGHVDEDDADVSVGKDGVITVTPKKGLKREAWAIDREILEQKRELMLQQARKAGYDNIEAAHRADVYGSKAGPWINLFNMVLGTAKDGASIYNSVKGKK